MFKVVFALNIYSQLLRCSAARGSGTGFCLAGPTIVNACKSMKVPLEFQIKNACLILLSHFILSHFVAMLFNGVNLLFWEPSWDFEVWERKLDWFLSTTKGVQKIRHTRSCSQRPFSITVMLIISQNFPLYVCSKLFWWKVSSNIY